MRQADLHIDVKQDDVTLLLNNVYDEKRNWDTNFFESGVNL